MVVCASVWGQDVLRGAADEILAVLKTEGMKDVERKRQIDGLLGGLTSEQYAQLVNLGKKITDYKIGGDQGATGGATDTGIDEEMGVAVVFDESEEEEEGDNYEVKDESEEVRCRAGPSKARTGTDRGERKV